MKHDEARIRSLIDTWVEATLRRDVPRVTALYAADVVSFDAIGPLQVQGIEAWRAHWQACMEQCPGDMHFRIEDVHIEVGGDVAFSRFLLHCGTTLPDGTTHSGWMRGTACYRRVGGEWKIAHDHCSVPFDPESCKALVELQPCGARACSHLPWRSRSVQMARRSRRGDAAIPGVLQGAATPKCGSFGPSPAGGSVWPLRRRCAHCQGNGH